MADAAGAAAAAAADDDAAKDSATSECSDNYVDEVFVIDPNGLPTSPSIYSGSSIDSNPYETTTATMSKSTFDGILAECEAKGHVDFDASTSTAGADDWFELQQEQGGVWSDSEAEGEGDDNSEAEQESEEQLSYTNDLTALDQTEQMFVAEPIEDENLGTTESAEDLTTAVEEDDLLIQPPEQSLVEQPSTAAAKGKARQRQGTSSATVNGPPTNRAAAVRPQHPQHKHTSNKRPKATKSTNPGAAAGTAGAAAGTAGAAPDNKKWDERTVTALTLSMALFNREEDKLHPDKMAAIQSIVDAAVAGNEQTLASKNLTRLDLPSCADLDSLQMCIQTVANDVSIACTVKRAWYISFISQLKYSECQVAYDRLKHKLVASIQTDTDVQMKYQVRLLREDVRKMVVGYLKAVSKPSKDGLIETRKELSNRMLKLPTDLAVVPLSPFDRQLCSSLIASVLKSNEAFFYAIRRGCKENEQRISTMLRSMRKILLEDAPDLDATQFADMDDDQNDATSVANQSESTETASEGGDSVDGQEHDQLVALDDLLMLELKWDPAEMTRSSERPTIHYVRALVVENGLQTPCNVSLALTCTPVNDATSNDLLIYQRADGTGEIQVFKGRINEWMYDAINNLGRGKPDRKASLVFGPDDTNMPLRIDVSGAAYAECRSPQLAKVRAVGSFIGVQLVYEGCASGDLWSHVLESVCKSGHRSAKKTSDALITAMYHDLTSQILFGGRMTNTHKKKVDAECKIPRNHSLPCSIKEGMEKLAGPASMITRAKTAEMKNLYDRFRNHEQALKDLNDKVDNDRKRRTEEKKEEAKAKKKMNDRMRAIEKMLGIEEHKNDQAASSGTESE